MGLIYQQQFLKEELASRISYCEYALEFVDWNESMREKTRKKLSALKAIDPETVSVGDLVNADIGSSVPKVVWDAVPKISCGKCHEVFPKLVKLWKADLCEDCLKKAIAHEDVNLITEREEIRQEIKRGKNIFRSSPARQHTLDKLNKVDPETISLEEIQEILEKNIKKHLRCEECGKYSDHLVIIGAYYSDDEGSSAVCDSCLQKALELIQNVE